MGSDSTSTRGPSRILDRRDFPAFLAALGDAGYRVVGPTVRDRAIVYGEIRSEVDLPIGWTDRQEGGTYRLERRADAALFGYNVGPHSWKRYLFPAHERLWSAERDPAHGFRVSAEPVDFPPTAFLGVRACELAALRVQDRVFETAGDRTYQARRRRILRIAVQCGQAAATCFCTSMGTGPAVQADFDLRLTELLDERGHRFLIDAGSPEGDAILARTPTRPDDGEEARRAAAVVEGTARSIVRTLETDGLRDVLVGRPEHPRWADVARRCLACSNCTMACPTCFCQTTEEVPSLSGDKVERWRRWDSCFQTAFTELHGTPVRSSTESRYRQWLTHKLGSWHDQFGSSGCVGCGRCITWCPVGIDLTVEAREIRVLPAAKEARA